jgi:hypothetical protein
MGLIGCPEVLVTYDHDFKLLLFSECRIQVLIGQDTSFPGVRQKWFIDRFYWRLGSGCDDGTV